MAEAAACQVNVRSFASPEPLRPFIRDFVVCDMMAGPGVMAEDFLFPDLATLRYNHALSGEGWMRNGNHLADGDFTVVGPLIHDVRFRVASYRQWIVSLRGLGWSRLVAGSAADYANRMVDGLRDPMFAQFAALQPHLYGPRADVEAELARLITHFSGLPLMADPAAADIFAIQESISDPAIDTVGRLVDKAQISRRQLERLSLRAFGFSPKMLLRRSRFVRSLIDFTKDPSMRWVGAIDSAYHDQAHFVRDFREFMGMTPSEYAQHPRPITRPVLREFVRLHGDAGQG